MLACYQLYRTGVPSITPFYIIATKKMKKPMGFEHSLGIRILTPHNWQKKNEDQKTTLRYTGEQTFPFGGVPVDP